MGCCISPQYFSGSVQKYSFINSPDSDPAGRVCWKMMLIQRDHSSVGAFMKSNELLAERDLCGAIKTRFCETQNIATKS